MTDIDKLVRDTGAVRRGEFELSNAEFSEYYVDKYRFETDPIVLSQIAEEIAGMISVSSVDTLVGPELGAVPLVTATSIETEIDAAYIRKGETLRGTQARIEGEIQKGDRVVVIEDVTATGETILEAAQIAEEAGGVVVQMIVVVDRNEGAVSLVQTEDFELEYLIQISSGSDE